MFEVIRFFQPSARAFALILTCLSILFNVPQLKGQGFQTVISLTAATSVKNTAEKPQSKVWKHDNKWWAVFPINTGTYIWRLDGNSWTSVLNISSGNTAKADCKVVDNLCHIFLLKNENGPSQLVSVEYVASESRYALWSQRTSAAMITMDAGVEAATIDVDGKGRMWLASDGVDDIRVRWSDPPYSTWSDPIVIATGTSTDDICAIVSLPVQGQVGVLWSNQITKRFGFKTHKDGSSPGEWSTDEIPASQSALNVGNGMSDDHLNVVAGKDGTLYCAVKTSYDTPGYPKVSLLKRLPSGKWDDLYKVSESGTRGIVLLNDAMGKVKVVFTSQEDGGDILYSESSTSQISFTSPSILIKGTYNNPTSTKNSYESDIVILASDNTKVVGVLADDLVSASTQPESKSSVVYASPNPVDDLMLLEFSGVANAELSISIFDALGKIYVMTNARPENNKIQISLGDLQLSQGLHFLRITSENYSQVIKFIKK